jgi:hypothetical protein
VERKPSSETLEYQKEVPMFLDLAQVRDIFKSLEAGDGSEFFSPVARPC